MPLARSPRRTTKWLKFQKTITGSGSSRSSLGSFGSPWRSARSVRAALQHVARLAAVARHAALDAQLLERHDSGRSRRARCRARPRRTRPPPSAGRSACVTRRGRPGVAAGASRGSASLIVYKPGVLAEERNDHFDRAARSRTVMMHRRTACRCPTFSALPLATTSGSRSSDAGSGAEVGVDREGRSLGGQRLHQRLVRQHAHHAFERRRELRHVGHLAEEEARTPRAAARGRRDLHLHARRARSCRRRRHVDDRLQDRRTRCRRAARLTSGRAGGHDVAAIAFHFEDPAGVRDFDADDQVQLTWEQLDAGARPR